MQPIIKINQKEILTNPNQKIITVQKEKCDKNNTYVLINISALEQAAQNLKAGAFKLWIYFAKNQPNYQFALSNKDVNDSFGIKKDQYDTAIKELAEKGYLIKGQGNHYIFSEVSQKKQENPIFEPTKQENPVKLLQEKTTTEKVKIIDSSEQNLVVGKNHNEKWEKTTRNNT